MDKGKKLTLKGLLGLMMERKVQEDQAIASLDRKVEGAIIALTEAQIGEKLSKVDERLHALETVASPGNDVSLEGLLKAIDPKLDELESRQRNENIGWAVFSILAALAIAGITFAVIRH